MAESKPDSPGYATERAGVNKEELHKEMLDRHRACWDFCKSAYDEARADMAFAFTPDSQWDTWMTQTRTGRPMYTVNRLRQALKQITNDQRMNRPQPKVRPVEEGDVELAEIRQGLFRNIEQQSTADRAYDTAFQFAVGGGYGVWRITTQYADQGSFDQDIRIEEVANPYSVKFDPASRAKDRRDARFAFVDDQIPRSIFKERFPDAECKDFTSGLTAADAMWWTERTVRVAEYF